MANTNITITFSNIEGGDKSEKLETCKTCDVTGLLVGNVPMVRLDHLVKYMGAEVVSNSTSKWIIKRNGQELTFTKGSTTLTSKVSYKYYNPETKSDESKSIELNVKLPKTARLIDDTRYVPLKESAMQLGAYLVKDTDVKKCIVFDFRVNGSSTPYGDDNIYIVGGSWVTDWSSKGDTSLSSHFKVKEFWDKSSTSGAKQLKVAAKLIEVAERLRYYYNNKSSLTLGSAFRSWEYNKELNGWGNSFHMRGRAFDVTSANNGTTLYNAIFDEFRGNKKTPTKSVGFYRNDNFTTSKSKIYEIETMPRGNSTWLHAQVTPGIDNANDRP